MKFYLHYDKTTTDFIGWYVDAIHSVIPQPNIEVTREEYELYSKLMYENQKKLNVFNGRVITSQYVPEITWDDIRMTRDEKIDSTDWTQLPDVEESKRTSYAMYRQALRDIPQKYNTPAEVIWPQLKDYGIS